VDPNGQPHGSALDELSRSRAHASFESSSSRAMLKPQPHAPCCLMRRHHEAGSHDRASA
jgi:hypothetical protein